MNRDRSARVAAATATLRGAAAFFGQSISSMQSSPSPLALYFGSMRCGHDGKVIEPPQRRQVIELKRLKSQYEGLEPKV